MLFKEEKQNEHLQKRIALTVAFFQLSVKMPFYLYVAFLSGMSILLNILPKLSSHSDRFAG